jgi:hypothetical protein
MQSGTPPQPAAQFSSHVPVSVLPEPPSVVVPEETAVHVPSEAPPHTVPSLLDARMEATLVQLSTAPEPMGHR